jgi:hypothetical protein
MRVEAPVYDGHYLCLIERFTSLHQFVHTLIVSFVDGANCCYKYVGAKSATASTCMRTRTHLYTKHICTLKDMHMYNCYVSASMNVPMHV